MALTLTTPNTVLGVLSPKSQSARLVANIATVVVGSLILALSAKISVPVMPVPVTLQTLAVALLAAGFGWRIGVATVALYLVEGLAGLPVFATGGGIDYILRPSFGFLVGYLPMAYIIGRAADLGASRHIGLMFLAMLVGDAVAFAFGFTWLLVVANIMLQTGGELPKWLDAGNLIATAWNGAIAPFIVWDILKMAFAALSIVGIWKLLPKADKAA
jgi:biotin transport system substrate-specific component